jgi:hypothetical protein
VQICRIEGTWLGSSLNTLKKALVFSWPSFRLVLFSFLNLWPIHDPPLSKKPEVMVAASLIAEHMCNWAVHGSCKISSTLLLSWPFTDIKTDPVANLPLAAKVFSITGLLERILLDVGINLSGFKSLFVLQRVNKTFHTTIIESTKLRRLTFRPDTDIAGDTEPVLNPLLHDRGLRRVMYAAELSHSAVTGDEKMMTRGQCIAHFNRYEDVPPIKPTGS